MIDFPYSVAGFAVGAGAVGVTALVLLFPALATVRIVGTDIAHAVPSHGSPEPDMRSSAT